MNRTIHNFVKLLMNVGMLIFASNPTAMAISSADNALNLTQEEQAWINSHPVIRARVSNAPPYHFWQNGPKGISVDLLDNILGKLSVQVEYQHGMSWTDAIKSIRNREKVDLLLTAKHTTERESFLTFSQDYLKLPWVIFTRQDQQDIFGLENLFGKTIAIEKGYVLQKRLAHEFPQIKQHLVSYTNDALAAVSGSRVDAYIGNLTIAQYHIVQRGYTNLKVAAPTDLGKHTQAFAVRNDWPLLASILDKGLTAITPEERNDINRKYLSISVHHGIDLLEMMFWFGGVLVVVVIIVSIILRGNQRQKQEIVKRQKVTDRLRKIASQVPGVIFQFKLKPDGSSSCPYASDMIEDIYRVTPEDVREDASKVLEMSHPDDIDRVNESIQLSAQTLEPWRLEYRVRFPDGVDRWLLGDAIPEATSDGSVLWHGFITDITERREADLALRQSKEKYQRLSDDIGDKFIIFSHTGLTGELTYVSRGITPITGFTKEDVLNKPWNSQINWLPEDIAKGQSYATNQNEGTLDFVQLEMRFIHPNGDLRTMNVSTHAVRDTAGKLLSIDGIAEDITQQKQAEEEQIRLQRELQQAQKMEAVGQLSGGIAHDFNNILGIIIGNLDMLKQHSSNDQKALKRISTISRSAQRAADLTKQLLGFARQRSLSIAITDINQVIRGMDSLLIRSVTPEIKVETQFVDEPWLTEIDAGDLEDTVVNLVINARDAMSGGGQITMETDNLVLDEEYCSRNVGAKPGEYIQLAISDTGKGVSPGVQEHIFEPFFTTKPQGKGTGLGLAMAYGFVRRSGGYITVDSELGVGTTFRIYLPKVAETCVAMVGA